MRGSGRLAAGCSGELREPEEVGPALRVAMRPPIVDPDLISKQHLVPGSANPALAIWTARASAIETYRTALDATARTTGGLDNILQAALAPDHR